ncbi:MlaE family ABC transporter permease [Thiocystis violascens]|uniref:ABC-type transport system involved in resistance to organic solvents, permease component n=1 Tax=Thiocystis violascens (strain ATCC 17096 / DSM 198 / 6111) TaxID=765911 RepID=I3YDQ9_THIV6|nr:ABC transporter permease [Thiocystis violascens]AFL75127.1 ABC-type transport system involved in resistance to organic solvents, permease component [Thiocystis violascens DSM 198]
MNQHRPSRALRIDTQPRRPFHGPAGWIEGIGLAGLALLSCGGLYLRILAGRSRLDLPALAVSLRQAGLSILPAITLTSLAVGLILGRQTQRILDQFDLPGLVLVSVIHAVALEFVPILVGILVAGRAGVALAVRQATLTVSGEMDGLLANGIDPIRFTLGPVLLSMLLMSFAFAVWGSLITLGATGLWLWGMAELPPALFLDALTRALGPADLLMSVIKPMFFALLIGLIATVNGTAAGRDPQGIAQAATRTMIGAVAAILFADLFYSLLPRG